MGRLGAFRIFNKEENLEKHKLIQLILINISNIERKSLFIYCFIIG